MPDACPDFPGGANGMNLKNWIGEFERSGSYPEAGERVKPDWLRRDCGYVTSQPSGEQIRPLKFQHSKKKTTLERSSLEGRLVELSRTPSSSARNETLSNPSHDYRAPNRDANPLRRFDLRVC
jgi:hypothetical protein